MKLTIAAEVEIFHLRTLSASVTIAISERVAFTLRSKYGFLEERTEHDFPLHS